MDSKTRIDAFHSFVCIDQIVVAVAVNEQNNHFAVLFGLCLDHDLALSHCFEIGHCPTSYLYFVLFASVLIVPLESVMMTVFDSLCFAYFQMIGHPVSRQPECVLV